MTGWLEGACPFGGSGGSGGNGSGGILGNGTLPPPPPPVIFEFAGELSATSAADLEAMVTTTTSAVETVTGPGTVDRVLTQSGTGSIRVVLHFLATAVDDATDMATLLANGITVALPSGPTISSINAWRGGSASGGGGGMGGMGTATTSPMPAPTLPPTSPPTSPPTPPPTPPTPPPTTANGGDLGSSSSDDKDKETTRMILIVAIAVVVLLTLVCILAFAKAKQQQRNTETPQAPVAPARAPANQPSPGGQAGSANHFFPTGHSY